MMVDKIELTYDPSPDHIRQFARTLTWSKRSKITVMIISVLLPILAIGILLVLAGPRDSELYSLRIQLLLYGCFVGISSQYIYARVERAFLSQRNLKGFLRQGTHFVEINANGVSLRNDAVTSFFYWSAIHDVVDLSYGIGLNIMGTNYLPLPLTSLPKEMKKSEVVDVINTWRNA